MTLSRALTVSAVIFTSVFTSPGVVAELVRTKDVRTMKNAEENFISVDWILMGEMLQDLQRISTIYSRVHYGTSKASYLGPVDY